MKIPNVLSFLLGVAGTLVWGLLMVLSIAFVIYEQTLSIGDDKFILYFMIKYYPLIMLVLFLLALKFKDKRGLMPFSATALPSLFLIFLIYDMSRVSIIDWDEFETPSQQRFIYESAFGNANKLKQLLPEVQNVNFTGKAGLSPLLAAYIGRNKENFDYLLNHGANVNLMPQDSLQYNVADYIIRDFEEDSESQSYFELLVKQGLDIHMGTKLTNLLQSAAISKNKWYLHFLLENGLNADRKGSIFLSPIGIATLHKYWENALYLLPYSNQESQEEAAAIFYGNQDLYMNENAFREEFKQALLSKGIDFKQAFQIRDAERQKRLDRIHDKSN